MKYRHIPGSPLQVSEIGLNLGTFCRKELLIREDDALRWIRRAFDLGITLFDASEKDGDGYGETLLPKALPKQRDEWIISTKIGYDIYSEPSFLRPVKKVEQSFSPANLVLSVDHALRRLKTDRIDILQLHHITEREVERDEIWNTLRNLIQAGKVLTTGAVLRPNAETLRTGLDSITFRKPAVIQHDYNLLTPYPGRFLHASAATGKGFGDREILAKYTLTSPPQTPATETRLIVCNPFAGDALQESSPLSPGRSDSETRKLLGKIRDLAFLTGPQTGRSLPQAAIHWLLADPTTAAVVPEFETLDQLEHYAETPDKNRLTPDELDAVHDRQNSWMTDREKELEA